MSQNGSERRKEKIMENKIKRIFLGNAVALFGIILLLSLTIAPMAFGQRAVQRPIEDFLSAQGTFCVDDGEGGCFLFVPPDPNFLGWNNDLDSAVILFAGVDYAGLADAYAPGKEPKLSGTVTERPLKDGRAEVTVILHTKGANAWVIELDLAGDVLAQIAGGPTVFGHRPADVLDGAGQALGDSVLHVVFINSAPGAPLPDLIEINGTPALKYLAFSMRAQGPLTAEFGVPEGTPGRCTITQTGLFMTQGGGVALEDAFPAESIKLQVVGK
jgi:hypothetical protein